MIAIVKEIIAIVKYQRWRWSCGVSREGRRGLTPALRLR